MKPSSHPCIELTLAERLAETVDDKAASECSAVLLGLVNAIVYRLLCLPLSVSLSLLLETRSTHCLSVLCTAPSTEIRNL